jgi:hypothetical protein
LARKCSDSIEEVEEEDQYTLRKRDAGLIVVDIFVTILISQIQYGIDNAVEARTSESTEMTIKREAGSNQPHA